MNLWTLSDAETAVAVSCDKQIRYIKQKATSSGVIMTTVPPAKVKEFSSTTLEKIAYSSVATIPTREPNDQNRLGYSVWHFLSERRGTLLQAIHTSGARILIPEADVLRIVSESLKRAGISLE